MGLVLLFSTAYDYKLIWLHIPVSFHFMLRATKCKPYLCDVIFCSSVVSISANRHSDTNDSFKMKTNRYGLRPKCQGLKELFREPMCDLTLRAEPILSLFYTEKAYV